MGAVGDIGQGLMVKDLHVSNFIPEAETKCGLATGTLGGVARDSYTPVNDVTSHSNMSRDVAEINDLIGTDNAGALTIYSEGKNRPGKSLQGMAEKDWASAGADDTILQAYEAVLGEDFLHSYNLDAMQCDGSFQGKSQTMCSIATKKNLICTQLQYSQYEGEKAIAFMNQKNWDELYAFWHGVYIADDPLYGKNTPHHVQNSRDGNFGTEYRFYSFDAINAGQSAIDSGDAVKLRSAFNDFNQANAATFAQATLKYAYESEGAGDGLDKKWGEGYTYFRCGAGLMDNGLATFINGKFDPRTQDTFPENLFCDIIDQYIAAGDIGQGLMVKDLHVTNFIPEAETKCGLATGTLGGVARDSYTPVNDVTSHSNMSRDVAEINDLIGTDNAGALTIYSEGKNRPGKSLQGM